MSLTYPPGAGSGDMLASNNLSEVASQSAARTNLGFGTVDSLVAFFGNRMAEGTTVTIDCRGDSTYYGYLAGGTRASPTPIETLQAALRSYYNNTAAVTVNSGVSGYGTTDVMAGWAAAMAASSGDIILIGYGINDAQGATSPAITADQYAANLATLVSQVRAAGKLPVLETPLPVLAYGALGTQVKAERVKQFAAAMRHVARQLGVPLLDTFSLFTDAISRGASPLLITSDGIHLTQAGYNLRGYWLAQLFISAPEISDVGIFPATAATVRAYSGTNLRIAASASLVGYNLVANKVRIPFRVTRPGLDLHLANGIWQSGTTAATFKLNGATLFTISRASATLGTTAFAVDEEVCVARDIAPGFYVLEVDGTGSEDVAVNYLRATPSLSLASAIAAQTGTAPTLGQFAPFGFLRLETAANATAVNNASSALALSPTLALAEVEFEATLGNADGFFVYGSLRVGGSGIRGGCTFYLDGSTGYLWAATGTTTSFAGGTALGSTDLRGVEHTYRVRCNTDLTVSVYVDGTLVGTYTPTIPYAGGRFGAYSYGASKTVVLKNVRARS